MSRPDIKSCILIESPAQERDEQFKGYVTELLSSIYGEIPEWLDYRIGRRIMWRNVQFREFICVAGSVSMRMILRACRPGGSGRTLIVYGSSLSGEPVSKEIRGGVETEFDPGELLVV